MIYKDYGFGCSLFYASELVFHGAHVYWEPNSEIWELNSGHFDVFVV